MQRLKEEVEQYYSRVKDLPLLNRYTDTSMIESIKNVARQQAEQIIKEAEGNARKSVDDLGQEILMKKKELEDIKKQFDVYKAKMESLLISQLELLKDINKDEE